MPAAVTAAQAMPQPRSPLKRSATTPLFARSSASNNVPAEPSSDLSTSQDSNNPQTQTGADRQYVSSLPPAGLQAMQHALCRLSSQHHLSDYNRMKRLTATTASQPMAPTSSMPSAYRQSTWSSNRDISQSSALPTRTTGVPSASPSQAVAGYTVPLLPPGLAITPNYNDQASILDPAKASLSPPPAPPLHRSYTEEEGQNPHLHLGTSRGSIASSVALSTPALSMDSMPPSPPTYAHPHDTESGGHSDSSALATPPDNGSPRTDRASDNNRNSPLASKTKFDEHNDHELSERLLDAMDQSVVQTSAIPVTRYIGHDAVSGDTMRILDNHQQQHINPRQQQGQRLFQQSSQSSGLPIRSQKVSSGLYHPQHGNAMTSAPSRSSSLQHRTSALKSSSIPIIGQTSGSSTSSVNMSTSHSMMTHSSASSSMSRASTSFTSAHASGLSSSSAGMTSSSLSALAHAAGKDVSPQYGNAIVVEDDFSHTLYHIHVNHPGLAGVKTSLTHPMNVSPLIPPELLHLYGQSILHAVPAPPPESSQHQHQPYAYQQPRARSPLGKLAMHDMPPGSNLNNSNARPPSPTKSSSGSSAMHISRPTTPASTEGKTAFTEQQQQQQQQQQQNEDIKKPFVIQPSADIHSLTGPNASAALFSLTLPISQHLALNSTGDGEDGAGLSSLPIKLGNLVLSSCPGKKVRLSNQHLTLLGIPDICRPGTGPTMDSPLIDPRTLPKSAIIQLGLNRSPICRDLEMDFKRAISQADIKCVVCCIDDDELRFLGAAWEEYERVAKKLGLEIIRLPMAEGFAPPSPEVLDAHLSYLITQYTLQGKNCLVHCRGGVGRAGLFACSWMIKLGLLGQVINIHDPHNNNLDQELKIVEKVIEVIRKRRSAKAIETPQQVQFILQYTHWLASTGRHVTARQVLQEAGLSA